MSSIATSVQPALSNAVGRFHATDDETILQVCGNGLQFTDLRRKRHDAMPNADSTAGIACTAYLTHKNLFAYSPRVMEPIIYVYHKSKLLNASLDHEVGRSRGEAGRLLNTPLDQSALHSPHFPSFTAKLRQI